MVHPDVIVPKPKRGDAFDAPSRSQLSASMDDAQKLDLLCRIDEEIKAMPLDQAMRESCRSFNVSTITPIMACLATHCNNAKALGKIPELQAQQLQDTTMQRHEGRVQHLYSTTLTHRARSFLTRITTRWAPTRRPTHSIPLGCQSRAPGRHATSGSWSHCAGRADGPSQGACSCPLCPPAARKAGAGAA